MKPLRQPIHQNIFLICIALLFLATNGIVETKAQTASPKADSASTKKKMTVHFMVDFRGAMPKVKIPESIGIRGNAAPLSWDKTYLLTDPDQNGVYEAVVVFDQLSPGYMLEYKYVHDQTHRETIPNRSLWMKQMEIFVPLEKWNVAPRISDKKIFEDQNRKTVNRAITELDSTLYKTLFTCNPAQNRKFFTEDLEVYDGKTGFGQGRAAYMESLEKIHCQEKKTGRVVRKLMKNTMKIFPIGKTMVVQTGEHRFYESEAGKKDRPLESAKFSHLWRLENGEWKICRMIGYDQQPLKLQIVQ